VTFQLREAVSIAETDDGTVLLDEREGRYWQLNPSGGQVLRILLDEGSVEAAVAELTAQNPVSAEEATRDVTALLDQLRTAELLVPGAAEGRTP
jgi:Coenzyme PQQ synthesis protein D (PqqD)